MYVEPDAAVRCIQNFFQARYPDTAPRGAGADTRIQAANLLPAKFGYPPGAVGRAIHRRIVTDHQGPVATGPHIELQLVRA